MARTELFLSAAAALQGATFVDQVAKDNGFTIPPIIDGHLPQIIALAASIALTFAGWVSHRMHKSDNDHTIKKLNDQNLTLAAKAGVPPSQVTLGVTK